MLRCWLASKATHDAFKVDLNIAPRIEGVGWLDWRRYDDIVRMGYETASREIEKLDSELLTRIQAT